MQPSRTLPGLARSITALLALVLAACAPPAAEDAGGDGPAFTRSTGLALTYDILDDTDVAGFNFTAVPVDCDTGLPLAGVDPFTAFEDLEDLFLPGTGGMFENAPFDGSSQHIFSDHFFALPAGCYDVTVQPVTASGEDSKDCASATATGVEVNDGETTEIMLISQCAPTGTTGGLDVIAVINHPPQITGLTYDPSKFICEDTTTICVTATDPDNDPVTIVPTGGTGWTLVSTTEDPDTGVTCFEFQFPGPGDYEVTFTAYDMGYDADGVLVTMTEILANQGTPLTSEDALTVPVHVLPEEDCITSCECPEGFDLTPAGDECIRVVETDVVATGPTYETCQANDPRPTLGNPWGWRGALYPGGLVDTAPFFLERLYNVGVWACDVDGTDGVDEPLNEWIGFSVCLDIEEPGDYVVGIAADNYIRFRVNGVPFFTRDAPNSTTPDFTGFPGDIEEWNFRHWWMRPISLSSGLNIVELEGRNRSQVAGFGAELYGPYDPASLTSDAAMAALDHERNIAWSTIDLVGQPFITGEASGYACPDGFALNACEGEITCTQIERVPCE